MAVTWLTKLDLPPDVFAVVMATGIISVAAHDHAYTRLGVPLQVLAEAAFVALATGLVIRVLARPRSALGEITDPDVALRMFTSVAACTVLGVCLNEHAIAVWVLGALALCAWLVLTPLGVRDVCSRPRTELRDHAHGAWLLPSVATAGLAVTAADLAVHAGVTALLVVAVVGWLLGVLVYGAVTWLIAWRAVSAPFVPDEMAPDSWILMGALAISTLAGDHVLTAADATGAGGYVGWVRPLTLALWIMASLWIPVLLYAEVWQLDQRAGGLHYTQVWWSAVFPLGMYSSATAACASALDMPSLTTISLVFFWIAFSVWLLVAIGMLHTALGRLPARR